MDLLHPATPNAMAICLVVRVNVNAEGRVPRWRSVHNRHTIDARFTLRTIEHVPIASRAAKDPNVIGRRTGPMTLPRKER